MGLFTRTGRRPAWPMISYHFPMVRRRRSKSPATLAVADLSGAYLALDVHDELHLYVVLAVVALNVEIADNALASGQLTEEQHDAVCALTLTVTAGLIDYVPGDVR